MSRIQKSKVEKIIYIFFILFLIIDLSKNVLKSRNKEKENNPSRDNIKDSEKDESMYFSRKDKKKRMKEDIYENSAVPKKNYNKKENVNKSKLKTAIIYYCQS